MVKNIFVEKFDLNQHLKRYGAIYAFLIIVIVNSILNENFFAINTFWNLSIQALPIMLTALGMLFVISSGGIDISVGSIMAIAGVMCAQILTEQYNIGGGNVAVAMLMGILVATLVGAFNGFLIAYYKIQPIIVTLTMYIAGRGLARLMSSGGTVVFYGTVFNDMGLYRFFGIVPLQLIISLTFIVIVTVVLKKTTFGYFVQAIGENPYASILSGIKTKQVLISVYALSGFFASIAGLFTSARACCADPNTLGYLTEMDAIAAVAIGGTSMTGGKSRIIGTIFGALIIQLITITINMNNIHYAYARILKGMVIIFAVYLQRDKKK